MPRIRPLASFVLAGAALVLGPAAASPPPGAAQDATPSACPVTTPAENAELARAWFAAVAGDDPAVLAALAADDVAYHDPAPGAAPEGGDEGAAEWADERQGDFPDLEVVVERVVAEGDLVASYQRWTGTQEGNAEDGTGLPAARRPAEWVSMAMLRVECGKVAEVWAVADDLGRLRRLGVVTDEELQSAAPEATPAP